MSTPIQQSDSKKTAIKSIDPLVHHGFQLLYLESYSCLQELKVAEIASLYRAGLKYNLEKAHFNPESLQYVKKDIGSCAKRIELKKKACQKILQKYVTPESNALQDELRIFINDKRYLAGAEQQLLDLKKKCLQQVEIYPEDILTEFNLGWIYYHLENNYQTANHFFGRVINQCDADGIIENNFFAQLALRYQAIGYHFLGEKKYALRALRQAENLNQSNDYHYLYEMAQQLVDTNQKKAIGNLKVLIKHSPLYYLYSQSDPLISHCPEVDQLLTRFHTAKLVALKETVFRKWKDSELMRQSLPPEFDSQQVFDSCYESHLPLLKHQSYPVLCRTELISNKIVKNVSIKTKTELEGITQQLTNTIQTEQRKWKAVNLLGMMFVYIAALLTLASIFLFIGSDLLGLTEKVATINWQQLIPKIFSSVMGVSVLGVLLLQFNPPKLKKLAKNRSMLMNVLE